jgi:hypothetical protein
VEIAGRRSANAGRDVHDTFATPDKTGKKAHARVEHAGARKIVLVARIDAVYRVGMFRMAEYDDTNQQARNASRTA